MGLGVLTLGVVKHYFTCLCYQRLTLLFLLFFPIQGVLIFTCFSEVLAFTTAISLDRQWPVFIGTFSHYTLAWFLSVFVDYYALTTVISLDRQWPVFIGTFKYLLARFCQS
jgi:hypothetical protein